MKPDWYPNWENETCVLVAGGPSVSAQSVNDLRGKCRVAVVNNSFKLAPWADLLYVADHRWWDVHKDALQFEGLKVTPDESIHKLYGVNLVSVVMDLNDPLVFSLVLNNTGCLAHGGHGGHQLLNLVIQFGCRNIVLHGFDFVGSHWHENHERPLRNPRQASMDKWCERIDALAPELYALDVRVWNMSRVSALRSYDRIDRIEEVLMSEAA